MPFDSIQICPDTLNNVTNFTYTSPSFMDYAMLQGVGDNSDRSPNFL